MKDAWVQIGLAVLFAGGILYVFYLQSKKATEVSE